MSDEGNAYRERRLIHVNEKLCIMSLGILMTGLAHGATESGLSEDCRWYPVEDGLSSQQIQKCLPVKSEEDEHSHPMSEHEDLRPVETGAENESVLQNYAMPAVDDRPSSVADDDEANAGAPATGVVKAYIDASDVDEVDGDELDIEDAESDELDAADEDEEFADQDIDGVEVDEQGVSYNTEGLVPQQVSADRSLLEMSSSTTGSDDTELFNIDIETAEGVEDNVPSADEKDLFGIGSAFMKSSDDYDARTDSFSYRNNRREWFWPWQEASVRGLDWGVDVSRTAGDAGATEFDARHVQGMLGGYLSKGTYLQAQLGRHGLETDHLGDRNITSRHAAAMFGLKQNFSVQLETGRDFIYADGSVIGGITKQLTASEHSVSFRWRPYLRLRFQGQSGYREHEEDNNEARFADVSALYGIHPGWPWVWIGVGGKQLNYQREVSDYWSPDLYKAYGLRFESSFPLLKRLTGSAAANLDRLDEDGSRGNGYDIKAGLQYRLFGQLYGRVELQKSKSIQQDSTWTSDNVSFSLSGPLF